MFNLGFSELIVLGVIALVFIGPSQLPEVAKVVGRLLNEWKRATSDITSSFTETEGYRDWEDRKKKYLEEIEQEKLNQASLEKDRLEQESVIGAVPPTPKASTDSVEQLEMDLQTPNKEAQHQPSSSDLGKKGES